MNIFLISILIFIYPIYFLICWVSVFSMKKYTLVSKKEKIDKVVRDTNCGYIGLVFITIISRSISEIIFFRAANFYFFIGMFFIFVFIFLTINSLWQIDTSLNLKKQILKMSFKNFCFTVFVILGFELMKNWS